MTDTPSRRQILQSASAASAIALFGTSQASAASSLTARLIEASIRYNVPDRSDYDRFHLDSRPPYTVDSDRRALVVSSGAPDLLEQQLSDDAVIDEQVTNGRTSNAVVERGARATSLPVSLTDRMRVSEVIHLPSPHDLPTVTVHWNADGAAATVQSRGRIELAPESAREITLDSETVEVRTATTTDTVPEKEGVPRERIGPRTEYGTAEVEATPVVEIVDHGELTVRER